MILPRARTIAAVALAAGLAALAGAAQGGSFGPAVSLPSADAPNATGSIQLPAAFTSRPAVTDVRSADELQSLWHRAGAAYAIPWQVLAAINKMSRDKFGKSFADSTVNQQIDLLKEISKNERSPQTVEERFFRTIKYATADGYYTSEIGIHKELHYKGNTYLKEFTGCTHPEHQQ